MVNRLGRTEDQWSNRTGKVVLLVEGSICGHKYIRKNMKLTKKKLFAVIAISVHPSFSRVILFSGLCEKQENAH